MEGCKILNKTNGKESELYKELYNVLGTHELAESAYSSVMSEGFQEDFGDWVDNYEYAFFDSTMALRQNDQGEPKLFKKEGTDQYYFDGISERIFLNKVKFSEFTEEEVSEITNQMMYSLLSGKGKNLSFNHIDEDNLPNMAGIFKTIEERMDSYIYAYDFAYAEGQISEEEMEDAISKAELIKAYKEEFASEISDKIQSYGFKIRKNRAKESNEEDLENTPDGKDPNFSKDSFESNSKDSATTNTKLFLSQILDVYTDMDGQLKTRQGSFLNMDKFAEFEDVWSTLEPVLSDLVSIGHGDDVLDVFDQMVKKIDSLEYVKPWSIDLSKKLKGLSDFKKSEFVQAFSKTKLNFLVTEVNGKQYRVINASAVGSRQYKERLRWSRKFHNKWSSVGGNASDQTRQGLSEIKDVLVASNRAFAEKYRTISDEDSLDALMEEQEEFLADVLKRLGTSVKQNNITDFMYLSKKDEFDSINDLSQAIGFMIDDLLAPGGFGSASDKRNPFNEQKVLKELSKSIAIHQTNFSENTVVLNGGKMGWGYSSPSYLSNKVNMWKNDPSELKKLSAVTSNKNSQWISYLLASGKDVKRKDKERVSKERLEELSLVLAASFKSRGKSDGVDNKKQTKPDAINESIVKMLKGKIGEKSYMPTIVPADKSRRVEIGGLPFYDAKIKSTDGGLLIPVKTQDVFVGYFEDEYNRMIEAWNEIDSLPESEKIEHYHTGAMNGTKSQLFPSLSNENKDMMSEELYNALYKEDGRPLSNTLSGLTADQKKLLRKHIQVVLAKRTKDSYEAIKSVDNIDKDIMNRYIAETSNLKEAMIAMAGDHAVNGLMATIEYTKMFSGDPAYYKSMPDMIKRIPATYSDGLQLRLKNSDNLYFNMATIANVKVPSEYIDKIRESVTDKNIAKAYEEINTTDAQGWITPNRWKFLQEKLGKWTPLHDKAYANMLAGKSLSKRELKLAAQPLKGVYFEINDGRPVYLKYSQAVLIPSMVEGTPMQALLDKMTKDKDGKPLSPMDEIHEVVTADGVKVGAKGVTTINKEGTTNMLEDFELNSTPLSNRGWKLQQDLPTKLTKDAAVGSQIQKNIIAGIAMEEETYVFNNESPVSGNDILKDIHDTVSTLSDMGRKSIEKEFGIVNGVITNKERIYSALIEEFRGKDGGENIISALEKETPLDQIPQVRQQVQSMVMSIFNKEMTKITTNGGSFIQISNFGVDKGIDVNAKGIKIVSKDYDPVRGLKPPRIEDGVVKPGQAMMPYSALKAKILELDKNFDFDNATTKDLLKVLDPSALQMLAYRIPNQGMSSNDALEIVGILPDSMGDSIIAYDGIPAKTGSDFDIDKMFFMMHNLEVRNGKVQKVSPNQSSKEGVQNRLVDLYWSVLTSPSTYDAMMRSIDSRYLKDDIDGLFPAEPMGDLQIFAPVEQINIKFNYVSGKAGVGQTANMLVDHAINQQENIRLNTYLGVGHMTEEGFTKFDELTDVEGMRSISDSLSAFLNAYVDIAKDPYVSRGNHNSVTANVTFMLLRAGATVEWVNRFIGQPIIKDLVLEMEKSEGITSEGTRDAKGKKLTPWEATREKYGADKNQTTLNDSWATDLKSEEYLEKQIIAAREGGLPQSQSEVLNVFEGLMEHSKAFSLSVIASKSDTKGGGTSFAERLVIENRVRSVITSGTILGFEEKFKNTMLGTYHENSVEFVGNVLSNSSLSISASLELEQTFNNISNRMGRGELITSAVLAKDLDNSYYSYAMSGIGLFSENSKNIPALFTDLGSEISKLKDTTENYLIKELIVQDQGGYSFISIDSSNKPAIYKNKIYRSWNQLYSNPETKSLALNLVRYAYSSTGFQSGLGQFFSHIPHEILRAEGMRKDFKQMTYNSKDSSMDPEFRDQYFRHNWNDASIVPRVTLGQTSAIKGVPKTIAFNYMSDVTNDAISTGTNFDGKKTFPEFISVVEEATDNQGVPMIDPATGELIMYEVLYKYIGNQMVEKTYKKETKLVERPLYVKTHKLGRKNKKGNIVEWNYGQKSTSSQIPSNNVLINQQKMIDDILDEALSDPNFVPSAILMDATNEDPRTNLVEGEQIINKDDVKSYRDYLSKTGEIPSTFFTAKTTFSAFYNNETGKRGTMPDNVVWNINNSNNLYDAISNESGEVFIESVDLYSGIQYIAKGNIGAVKGNLDQIVNDNDITCN